MAWSSVSRVGDSGRPCGGSNGWARWCCGDVGGQSCFVVWTIVCSLFEPGQGIFLSQLVCIFI